jgi:uncharacterized membrane protein YheB (UPF0754 family)
MPVDYIKNPVLVRLARLVDSQSQLRNFMSEYDDEVTDEQAQEAKRQIEDSFEKLDDQEKLAVKAMTYALCCVDPDHKLLQDVISNVVSIVQEAHDSGDKMLTVMSGADAKTNSCLFLLGVNTESTNEVIALIRNLEKHSYEQP